MVLKRMFTPPYRQIGADEPDDDEPEYEHRYETVTREQEYTRHTSEVTWMDDDTETVEWDDKVVKDGFLVLVEHTGYENDRVFTGFEKQVVASYPTENIKKFETVDRETRTVEYTETNRLRVRVDDDDDD